MKLNNKLLIVKLIRNDCGTIRFVTAMIFLQNLENGQYVSYNRTQTHLYMHNMVITNVLVTYLKICMRIFEFYGKSPNCYQKFQNLYKVFIKISVCDIYN